MLEAVETGDGHAAHLEAGHVVAEALRGVGQQVAKRCPQHGQRVALGLRKRRKVAMIGFSGRLMSQFYYGADCPDLVRRVNLNVPRLRVLDPAPAPANRSPNRRSAMSSSTSSAFTLTGHSDDVQLLPSALPSTRAPTNWRSIHSASRHARAIRYSAIRRHASPQ